MCVHVLVCMCACVFVHLHACMCVLVLFWYQNLVFLFWFLPKLLLNFGILKVLVFKFNFWSLLSDYSLINNFWKTLYRCR